MPQPILSPLPGRRAEVALPALLAPTLPIHHMRVEPIFHTGSLLFAIDDPPVAEVVNDTSGVLADFWRTMRDESAFKDFAKLCNSTPYSEAAFLEARMVLEDPDPVLRAWAFFVMNRMGTLENSSRLATISKKRTRRVMTEQAASFLSAVDRLPQFHERFRGVTHLSRDPLAVVREFDQQDVLIVTTPQASKPGFAPLSRCYGVAALQDQDHTVHFHLPGKAKVTLTNFKQAGKKKGNASSRHYPESDPGQVWRMDQVGRGCWWSLKSPENSKRSRTAMLCLLGSTNFSTLSGPRCQVRPLSF